MPCLESKFEIKAAGLEGRENQIVTGEAGSNRLLRTDFPCFFPTHDQQLRIVSLKSAVRAGLRYGKWQTFKSWLLALFPPHTPGGQLLNIYQHLDSHLLKRARLIWARLPVGWV